MTSRQRTTHCPLLGVGAATAGGLWISRGRGQGAAPSDPQTEVFSTDHFGYMQGKIYLSEDNGRGTASLEPCQQETNR